MVCRRLFCVEAKRLNAHWMNRLWPVVYAAGGIIFYLILINANEIIKATGLTYLGTIHTHNGNIHEEIPSGADNLGAIASGEYFFDIDSIHRQPAGRLRHDVKFWFPQRPIN